MGCPVKVGEDLLDLGAGEDCRETFRSFGGREAGEGRQRAVKDFPIRSRTSRYGQGLPDTVKDFPIEEDEGTAGDILGGSGDFAFEVCEKKANIVRGEVLRVPFAVEKNELPDTKQVSFFRAKTSVRRLIWRARRVRRTKVRKDSMDSMSYNLLTRPVCGGGSCPWMALRSLGVLRRVIRHKRGQSPLSLNYTAIVR